MTLSFPIDNHFYIACYDCQSMLPLIMEQVGFSKETTSIDDYDLPCVSLYEHGTGGETNVFNTLISLAKLSPRTEITLFESISGLYSVDEILQDRESLIRYAQFGLLDSVFKLEVKDSFFKNELKTCDVYEDINDIVKLNSDDFLKIINDVGCGTQHQNVVFKLKFSVPLDFKSCQLSEDKRSISLDVLYGFKSNCIKKLF